MSFRRRVSVMLLGLAAGVSVAVDVGVSSASPSAAQCVSSSSVGLGARGSEVRVVQSWLSSNGFRPGPVDGWFGQVTQGAVRRAERAYGWAVDGRLDRAEMSAMGVACSGGSVPESGGGCVVGRVLSHRMSGPDVLCVEERLRAAGFQSGWVDGFFGTVTVRSVSRLQGSVGLPVTGVADAATLGALGVDVIVSQPPVSQPPVTQPPATQPSSVDPAWTSTPVQVHVPRLGLTRQVILGGDNVQAVIDSCRGAVQVTGFATPVYLAAHRTSCGSAGFGGVETLQPGDVIRVTYANGMVRDYRVGGVYHASYGDVLADPAHGATVALQTSIGGGRVRIIAAWPA